MSRSVKPKSSVPARVNVYYLGPPGTFAWLVARKRFPKGSLIPCPSISDAMEQARLDPSPEARCVVPFLNTTAGEIGETVDTLLGIDHKPGLVN